MYYSNLRVEVHYSARRHGVTDGGIRHAVAHPVVIIDVDADADPPKVLVIGPDMSGTLLEVIMLTLEGDRLLAIHAMPLRRAYYPLLPEGENGDA